MTQPGVITLPPPLARGPHAPPPVPPADPWMREYLRGHVVRMISASGTMAMGIIAAVIFWLPLIGLLFGLGVVIMHRYQLRLIDYYAAYFQPAGYPDRGTLQVGYVFGWIAVGLSALSSLGWVYLMVSTA
ncbi:hypothetical protein [Microlunatus speluncae]|uniref:hypothetical protein n=1 Tax=Microlunatus speluncae TaxID=2594267 RepID=UPI00126671E7|nr:hypothetical protein [Microlunatus speluncae]